MCSNITYGYKKENYKSTRMDIDQTDTGMGTDSGNHPLDTIIGKL
jgi:hypothetical protein